MSKRSSHLTGAYLPFGVDLNCSESRRRAAWHPILRIHVRPALSILSNALNLRCSAIAALVRSPWRYCPLRSPGGLPLPFAPPCSHRRSCGRPAAGSCLCLRRLVLGCAGTPHLGERRLWDSNGSEVALRQSWRGLHRAYKGSPPEELLSGSACRCYASRHSVIVVRWSQ